jgi:hypothetical protein
MNQPNASIEVKPRSRMMRAGLMAPLSSEPAAVSEIAKPLRFRLTKHCSCPLLSSQQVDTSARTNVMYEMLHAKTNIEFT